MMYGAIFAGGALGSVLRELLSASVAVPGPMTSTFLANVVACFVIGALHGVRHRIHAHVMHLAAIGFCGGLSTFSGFTADVFASGLAGDVSGAVLGPVLEIGVGLLAAVLGEALARRLPGATSR